MVIKNLFNKIHNQFFYLLGVGIFFFFVILSIWGENGLLRLVEMNNIKKQAVSLNQKILQENLLLKQEIERLHDAKYLEQRVRSDLGLIKPNEKVFIIPEEPK